MFPFNRPRPTHLSILSVAILIALGTILFMFPVASTGRAIGFVDALFTTTSALCVTGLVVLDTGKDLSLFGQMMLLILIQVGGLGIMTLSTALLLVVGRRPSLSGRMVIQDTFTYGGDRSITSLLLDVVRFTFVIEAVGAVLMCIHFLPGRSLDEAFFLSVFHAVSAFCNAGFSLFSDSFIAYRGDWVMNLTICFLIISGGIGFLVLAELKRNFPFSRRTWPRLSLHSKLALSSMIVLVSSGTILILLMEWQNTLSELLLPERFLSALFQSVTTRTAGFNTLAIGELANETLFVITVLMFIGASSGSCGGGIKTGTFASLIVLGMSRIFGHDRPKVFHRTISEASVGKAISVVMISLLIITSATLALLVSEIGGVSHYQSEGKFLEILFEVISAFGTVGLSMGITGGLTPMGKLIVVLVMFTGRLGPLMIAVAVSRQRAIRYHYAEEGIMIG